MLKVSPVGSNQTEVSTDTVRVLFSYKTPVAAWVSGRGFVRTEKHYSVTTSKHVNQWLSANGADPKSTPTESQSYFDNLLEGQKC